MQVLDSKIAKVIKNNNEIRTENGMTFKMLQNLRTEPDIMALCETEV